MGSASWLKIKMAILAPKLFLLHRQKAYHSTRFQTLTRKSLSPPYSMLTAAGTALLRISYQICWIYGPHRDADLCVSPSFQPVVLIVLFCWVCFRQNHYLKTKRGWEASVMPEGDNSICLDSTSFNSNENMQITENYWLVACLILEIKLLSISMIRSVSGLSHIDDSEWNLTSQRYISPHITETVDRQADNPMAWKHSDCGTLSEDHSGTAEHPCLLRLVRHSQFRRQVTHFAHHQQWIIYFNPQKMLLSPEFFQVNHIEQRNHLWSTMPGTPSSLGCEGCRKQKKRVSNYWSEKWP